MKRELRKEAGGEESWEEEEEEEKEAEEGRKRKRGRRRKLYFQATMCYPLTPIRFTRRS